MKRVSTVLAVVLMALALSACLFSVRWFFAISEVQRLQASSDAMTRTSGSMQQLAMDAIEYGRKNPAIHSVLNQLNLRAGGLGATNSPGPIPAVAPAPAVP